MGGGGATSKAAPLGSDHSSSDEDISRSIDEGRLLSGLMGALVDIGIGMLAEGRRVGVSRSRPRGRTVAGLLAPDRNESVDEPPPPPVDDHEDLDDSEPEDPAADDREEVLRVAALAPTFFPAARVPNFFEEDFLAALRGAFLAVLFGAAFFRPAAFLRPAFRAVLPLLAAFRLGAAFLLAFFAALAIANPP